MSKMIVIVNPHANRGDSKHQIDAGLQALAGSDLDFDILLTEKRGHATKLAEDAARAGVETIVAAGGDGTVNEVVNGILQAFEGQEGVAPTTLGILPIGSGNDFSWGLGLHQGMTDALERLQRSEARVIDVGYIEPDTDPPSYFVNIVGGGFDARVNIEAQKMKRVRGFAIYLFAVFRTMAFYYNTPDVTIRFDDQELNFPMLMALFANGPRFGGGFLAAPHASHADGLLDLCLVRKMGRLDMLRTIPKLMKGTHLDHPKVTMARTASVTIESPAGFPSEADGEMVGYKVHRMKISIIPLRLKVIT